MGKKKHDRMLKYEQKAARKTRIAMLDFAWRDTIEGYGYWKRVYDALFRIETGRKNKQYGVE